MDDDEGRLSKRLLRYRRFRGFIGALLSDDLLFAMLQVYGQINKSDLALLKLSGVW